MWFMIPTFDTSMSGHKIKDSNSIKPGSKGLELAWSVEVTSRDWGHFFPNNRKGSKIYNGVQIRF